MNDFPVRVGSTLFTLVDPEPGFEAEYNRWYERDHFYAGCMVDRDSYLAIYWVLEGKHGAHFKWAVEQVIALDRADGVTQDQLGTHLAEVSLPLLMGADGATGSGVASMVSWNYQSPGSSDTDNAPMDLGMPPGGPERSVQMFFLDREPTEVWDRFRSYTDQLW